MRVVESWEDPSTGLLWQHLEADEGDPLQGTLVRAVCRPESCADGHRCGQLDLGVVE